MYIYVSKLLFCSMKQAIRNVLDLLTSLFLLSYILIDVRI